MKGGLAITLSLAVLAIATPTNPAKVKKTLLPFLPHNQQQQVDHNIGNIHLPCHKQTKKREIVWDNVDEKEELEEEEGKIMLRQDELWRLNLTKEAKRGLEWGKQIEYSGKTFFDGWEFFTEPDPTHGLVNYVDHDTAFQQGLAFWTQDGVTGIQTEHWSDVPVGTPRNSVRIHSKALFAGGLFIIDVKLLPWGCGVWPAFWTLGYEKEWPLSGEIDIIEGIQAMTANQMTVHTLPGCNINQTHGLYTGSTLKTVCDSTTGGSGCSILSSSNSSYGMPFNAAGGGVYATLWDVEGVKIWDWTRDKIPQDIKNDVPDPTKWGTPAAAFDASTCDPGYYFGAQELILNINLCGDWAGNNYKDFPYCPGTCAEYVSKHTNLNNTVFLINSLKVYQQTGAQPLIKQAEITSNQTGVGGPIARPTGHAFRPGSDPVTTVAFIMAVVTGLSILDIV